MSRAKDAFGAPLQEHMAIKIYAAKIDFAIAAVLPSCGRKCKTPQTAEFPTKTWQFYFQVCHMHAQLQPAIVQAMVTFTTVQYGN